MVLNKKSFPSVKLLDSVCAAGGIRSKKMSVLYFILTFHLFSTFILIEVGFLKSSLTAISEHLWLSNIENLNHN
jgi:hypothetical protein